MSIQENKYLFHELKEGGSFNLINAFLQHTSLFLIEVSQNASILKLSRDDLNEISKTNKDLYHKLTYLKAEFG